MIRFSVYLFITYVVPKLKIASRKSNYNSHTKKTFISTPKMTTLSPNILSREKHLQDREHFVHFKWLPGPCCWCTSLNKGFIFWSFTLTFSGLIHKNQLENLGRKLNFKAKISIKFACLIFSLYIEKENPLPEYASQVLTFLCIVVGRFFPPLKCNSVDKFCSSTKAS